MMIALFIFLTLISTAISNVPSQNDRRDILNGHNNYRQMVNPPAKNMQYMKYSLHLEELAERWVKKCEFKHPNVTEYPEYYGIGQNIAVTQGWRLNWPAALKSWYDEYKDYDYNTNQCKPGKVCGHYTQLVWATSTRIGCAVQECNNLGTKNPVFLYACQYEPWGNFEDQKPYIAGDWATKCLPNYTPNNKLCDNGKPDLPDEPFEPDPYVSPTKLTPQERQTLANRVTKIRGSVKPPAANMLYMEYDKDLERLAFEYTQKCIFSEPDVKQFPQYKGLGANIAADLYNDKDLLLKFLRTQGDEGKFYNYETNTCTICTTCRMYKRLAWANATRFGCAWTYCKDILLQYSSVPIIQLCLFSPTGDVNGNRPYEKGESCSNCPEGYKCDVATKLCRKSIAASDFTF